MSQSRYHILGLGNAIVDIIAQTPDDFISGHGLTKGSMTLTAEDAAERLYRDMGKTITVSGGSAANTIIGMASFGCSGAFVGKVKADPLGTRFADDIRAAGIAFLTPAADAGPATARCLVLVTPDGQRTMNTFLGACQNLSEDDVDAAVVEASEITYLEGYLWDPPAAKAAFVKAARIARAAGRRVALTLSDAFCVGRYRDEFRGLIRDGMIDILFANEAELTNLYPGSDFDTAVTQLQAENILAAVTRGAEGCVVVTGAHVLRAPASAIAELVDTTGAGDLFAAGFMTGLVHGQDHATCARLGALAAGEIIQHIGARPRTSLRALATQAGIAL